jgi:hypothetical protein
MIYREATGSEPWGDDNITLADMAEGLQVVLSVVKVDPAIIDTLSGALGAAFSWLGEVGWKSVDSWEADKARYEAAFAAIGRDVPDGWEDE